MNKIYRTVYSQILGTWVAVSELVSAKGKQTGSSRSASMPASAGDTGWRYLLSRDFPLKTSVLALALALPLSGYASTITPVGCNTNIGLTFTGLDGTNTTGTFTDGSGYYSTVTGCGANGNGKTGVTLFGSGTQVTGNYEIGRAHV